MEGTVACGNNTFEGEVQIIKNSSQEIEKGRILVTTITDPTFFSQIINCGALITDSGGILCHAAILSRELSKPCIVGTKNATELLKDGDKVLMNLKDGKIRKIK